NVTPSNTNNFNGEDIFYDGNYESIEKNKRKHYTLTFSTTDQTTIDVEGYDILVLNIASDDIIASLDGGYQGKRLSIYNFGGGGATTFKNYNGDSGDNIYLSGGANTFLKSLSMLLVHILMLTFR
ncbi:unnamed protein product, partial [marine sediment metagenome]